MNRISALLDSLNTTEQWMFRFAATAVVIGCVGVGAIALSYVTETTPEYGGTYTEGLVGYPTAPNPILATTSTDQSLIKLVYSGILRKVSWNNYQPDLGSCAPLQDPSTIKCIISDKAFFHDGKPVTARDVLFTVETIQKTGERSPLYPSFVGVVVTAEDSSTVLFHLPKPFSGFNETLTTGIIPEHIWKNVSVAEIESQSTLERMMIGSGPYIVTNQVSSTDHIKSTRLKSNPEFISGMSYISTINLNYYSNIEEIIHAFNKKSIDGFILESKNIQYINNIKSTYSRIPVIHPDIYGLFTRASLTSEKNHLIQLEPLVRSVNIANYGFPWNKPLPPWDADELLESFQDHDRMENIGNEPSVPLTESSPSRILVTVDQEPLVSLAGTLSRSLSLLQFPVEMRVFDFSGFKNSVVPKRSFNFLVFGQRYRHVSDAYAYWNSNERSDPGLNVTETVDLSIDTYSEGLTRQGRTEHEYKNLYSKLTNTIASDHVFLPLYLDRDIYIFHNNSVPMHESIIYNPTVDRLNSISNWYLHTSLQFKKDLWQN